MNSPLSTVAREEATQGPLELGSRLRKYEILQRIGQGGYASVYRARDIILKRDVAIKVIHRIGGVTEDMMRRGQAEAVFLNKIRHPGIVEVYDADVTDSGLLYIVMELLVGRSMHEVLHEHRRLAVEEALSIAVQVADAVNAAHELGAIHRDLKPENIFVLAGNKTKILDFGIAKFVNDVGAKTTAKDALQGSVLYMSPEHVQGTKVGPRTDIYALGIILYRALLGEHPVLMDIQQPATAWSVASWHVEKMPRPLCDLAPWVPTYVSRFVSSACAKKPERRPESMAEVARQARALLKRFLAETEGELKGQTRELSSPAASSDQKDPSLQPVPAPVDGRSALAPQPALVSSNPSRLLGELGLHNAVTSPVNDRTIPGMGFRPVPVVEQAYGSSRRYHARPAATSESSSAESRRVAPAATSESSSAESRRVASTATSGSPPAELGSASAAEPRRSSPAAPPLAVAGRRHQRPSITDLSLVSSAGLTALPSAREPSLEAARGVQPSPTAVKGLFIGAAVSGALFFGSITSAYLAHRRHAAQIPSAQVPSAQVPSAPRVTALNVATPVASTLSPNLHSEPSLSASGVASQVVGALPQASSSHEPALSVAGIAQPVRTEERVIHVAHESSRLAPTTSSAEARDLRAPPAANRSSSPVATAPRQAGPKAKKLTPSELRLKALEEELARRQRAKATSHRTPFVAE